MTAWVFLGLAILSETVGSAALRASVGFSKPWPSAMVAIGFGVAFYLLSQTLKTLPLGMTYALWAGVGTALTSLIGWVYFKDPFQVGALVGIGIIILGVVVLNLYGVKH